MRNENYSIDFYSRFKKTNTFKLNIKTIKRVEMSEHKFFRANSELADSIVFAFNTECQTVSMKKYEPFLSDLNRDRAINFLFNQAQLILRERGLNPIVQQYLSQSETICLALRVKSENY